MKISVLKFQVRHIRGTQNIMADTLSSMFESSPPDEPDQVVCNLVLTAFPLAFQELGQLEDVVLAAVIAKLEGGNQVGLYSLSKGVLYCRSSKGRGQKIDYCVFS